MRGWEREDLTVEKRSTESMTPVNQKAAPPPFMGGIKQHEKHEGNIFENVILMLGGIFQFLK